MRSCFALLLATATFAPSLLTSIESGKFIYTRKLATTSKMKSAQKLLAAPLLAAGTLAQFVPAPTDLITKEGYANISVRYKEVPTGICELDPNVKSYSGYADIAEDQHVFWWFFESRNQDPSEAPLTVVSRIV
jgi:carboxypeptidase C (cathepsin A)